MLKAVFWNISKESGNYSNIRSAIETMLKQWKLDVMFLADFNINQLLNSWELPQGYSLFHPHHNRILTIFSSQQRITVNRLTLNETVLEFTDQLLVKKEDQEWVFFLVHLKSKAGINNYTQAKRIDKDLFHIHTYIKDHQKKSAIVAIGDFNIHPYDDKLLDVSMMRTTPNRLTALQTKLELKQTLYHVVPMEQYVVASSELYWNYNPTWALFGDFFQQKNNFAPPASHYFDHENIYNNLNHQPWQMFDQIILSYLAINSFQRKEFKLIDRMKNHIFYDSKTGKMNVEQYSDHLPLRFALE